MSTTYHSNDGWMSAISTKVAEVIADTTNTYNTPVPSASELARTIDHTLLKPDATPDQIDKLCGEALKYGFKSCCVNGSHIPHVAHRLRSSSSIPCAVVGFPLGAMSTSSKAFEATDAIKNGAQEIDMVLPLSHLKAKDYTSVYSDIAAVVKASSPIPVKVILETVFLTPEEIVAASFVAAEAGATFVKTCTGFNGGMASPDHVRLMKKAVAYKPGVQVKASGGVRSLERCLEMVAAGADRVGTSSGVGIMEEFKCQA